jgi:hypothetical protein
VEGLLRLAQSGRLAIWANRGQYQIILQLLLVV